MNIEFESGLELIDEQPACVRTTLFASEQNGFTVARDGRGSAFLFKRLEQPAVFVEVIQTRAGKVRGNHVHYSCAETLHVVSGGVFLYLLCEHGKHVFKQFLKAGEAIVMPAGTPHALYCIQDSECVVLFDKDPSNDRTRIPIVRF